MPTHIYLWHPIFVHFTLALLCASVLLYFAARLTGNLEWRRRLVAGAELNLWGGTALTVLTVIFGWLAFDSVPHDDSAHGDMELHRALALATFGWFAVLALLSPWHRRQVGYPSMPFLAAMAIGLVGLVLTGMRGGELVFEHGLAVARATAPESPGVVAHDAGHPEDDHHGASHDSPYAGQQSRALKALSAQEIDDLAEGRGMGTSKAAELNHYPGPKHVLDAAQQLGLTHEQVDKTKAVQASMSNSAQAIGRQIVAKETELEALFSGHKANAENVGPIVEELGKLQASFRLAHLNAHMAMVQVLKPQQIAQYDSIRGYSAPSPPGHEGHHHHH
jgi:uncharacterized membrane protein/Spy/CpxP family protein refolding chaperone